MDRESSYRDDENKKKHHNFHDDSRLSAPPGYGGAVCVFF